MSRIYSEKLKCLVVHEGLENAPEIKTEILSIIGKMNWFLTTKAHLSDCALNMGFIANSLNKLAESTFEAHTMEKKCKNIFILNETLNDDFIKGDIVMRGVESDKYFNMSHEVKDTGENHKTNAIYNLTKEQLGPASYYEAKLIDDYLKRKYK